ncbi:hybrid sensor histidine kinase/response regulator [Kamptonema sp. UHCC 0994]|uniref:hybrid sensor histidine kinase/response regulator n=1 Tax=Kamptonema sp. UHCC 0994 TaxID=3031329 RepID=UPI0023B96DE6|nr:hybrid sensor histidine kinase/response regulator [Kamptonema sp. UHCC 0994]MDF0553803.1 hybrid sensor histidine kinase/response regulator [Kamptonema sp. UHCC 0994]
MIVDDEELRNVFKTASEEHLQKLDDGFLYLDKYPSDSAKLEELLRETHSLKGDAGMLGVKDVSTLAHQMEHLLGSVKRGETAWIPEISDRLSQGLDALRKLVNEAVTGEPSGINSFYILASMMGASTPPQGNREIEEINSQENLQIEESKTQIIQELEIEDINFVDVNLNTDPSVSQESYIEATLANDSSTLQTNLEQKLPQLATKTAANITISPAYRIETIRVPTQNLDALMTQAGELTVTKIRLAHRLSEIEEITNLWEDWSRNAFINRFAANQIENLQNSAAKNGTIAQLQKYYQYAEERLESLGTIINRLRRGVYEDTARLDLIADELEEGIRTLRLLPLSTIFNLFPRMVKDLARQEGKEIELIIEGGETRADKRILEEMKDPLMHMIRNAIDHGVETPAEREKKSKPRIATIHIKGYNTATNIIIEVSDNGRGLNIDQIKETAIKRGICTEEELASMTVSQIQHLIFSSGFSTRTFVTEVSGRGVGLDVVRTNVEALKGTIQVESTPEKGCTLRLLLGTTLATAHVLIVAVSDIYYALPVEFVQTTRLVSQSDIFPLEGRETIVLDGEPLSVAKLANLLELDNKVWDSLNQKNRELENSKKTENNQVLIANSAQIPCIILKVGEEQLGLFVDALIDEQDVVLKPQSHLLKRVRNIAGATILGTGEVCMVLNPQDLIKSIRKQAVSRTPLVTLTEQGTDPVTKKQLILLAEDSIATRTQEKRILEAAGYEVVTAVDGLDAYNKLKTRAFDAVVSDVQMPNLDGLALTAKIRQHREYNDLPIILVTSLASDEDKKRGAEAGANAYITKGNFNQEVLLQTLGRLV